MAKAISKLQSTPDYTEDIRKATSKLHSIFSEYQLAWVSLMDYTALASTPEQQQDCEALEEQTRTCKSLVQAAVIEAINRKTIFCKNLDQLTPDHAFQGRHSRQMQCVLVPAAALKRAEM